jgi:ribonuclease HI
MPWMRATFNENQVWVEVDDTGRLRAQSGRVAMRYSDSAGAKIYRAGVSRITPQANAHPEELPEGTSADAPAKKPARKGTSGFGSAGTRTKEQAAGALAAAGDLVASFAPDAVLGFTDGACQGNPGPCGAGAVVKLPDGRHLERSKALGIGTNNVGELSAVGLALDLLDEAEVPATAAIEIMTDSKYTNGVLALGWKAKANVPLIESLRRRLAQRRVRIHWVAGHVGIPENERADELANQGVEDSKLLS